MKYYHLTKIIIILLILSILTGCWDSIELEDRAFIFGIALDLVEEGDGSTILLTEQIVAPAGIGAPTIQGGEEKPYRNISAIGDSLTEINTDLSHRANRALATQHLQVLILSERVVQEPSLVTKILDPFVRGQDMRRGLRLVVSKDQANSFLDIKPEHVKLPVQYLMQLIDNQHYSKTIESVRMGDVQEYLINDFSFSLPYITKIDDQNIDISGAAVFNSKQGKVVGILNGEETLGLNLLKGEIRLALIKITIEDDLAAIRINQAKSNLKFINKNPLTFEIQLDLEGAIAENYSSFSPFDVSDFEGVVEDKVTKLVNQTIDKLQNDFHTDVLDIGIYLRGRHYKLWEKIKDDWDSGKNLFSNSEIKVNVNVSIRHQGDTIDSMRKGMN